MLMDGTYYEITGGMSEDIITKGKYTDKTAKEEAIQTERVAYKNTYVKGKRVKSVKLYDPYGDEYYCVGEDYLYEEPLPEEIAYQYQMLGRLKADCDYYLGYGNRYEGHLWAGSVEEQISEMKDRWNKLEEKPEWLTMEMIDEYERRMANVS